MKTIAFFNNKGGGRQDEAIGGHQSAVTACREDFEVLAWLLLEKMKIEVR